MICWSLAPTPPVVDACFLSHPKVHSLAVQLCSFAPAQGSFSFLEYRCTCCRSRGAAGLVPYLLLVCTAARFYRNRACVFSDGIRPEGIRTKRRSPNELDWIGGLCKGATNASLRRILSLELWWGAPGWLALVCLSGRDDGNDRQQSQDSGVPVPTTHLAFTHLSRLSNTAAEHCLLKPAAR